MSLFMTGTNITRANSGGILEVVSDPSEYIIRMPRKFDAIEPDDDFNTKNIIDILKKDKNTVYVRDGNGELVSKEYFNADYELKISQYRSSQNKTLGHLLSREEALIEWIRDDQPSYDKHQIFELASSDPKCNADTLRALLNIKDEAVVDTVEEPVIEEPVVEAPKPVSKKRSVKKTVKKEPVLDPVEAPVIKNASEPNTEHLKLFEAILDKLNESKNDSVEEQYEQPTKPLTITSINGTIRIPVLDFVLDDTVVVVIQDASSDFLYEPVMSNASYTLACDSVKVNVAYSGICYTVPSTNNHHTIYLVEK